MLILTIRTDKPEAEIGVYENLTQLACYSWEAHRQLAETIHVKLKEMLADKDKQLTDIEGLLFFKGPGSFTGLRIGASVANALADSLNIAIVAKNGDEWIEKGLKALLVGGNDKIALPEYGSEPRTTIQKK